MEVRGTGEGRGGGGGLWRMSGEINAPLQSFFPPKAPSCKHFFTLLSSLVLKIFKAGVNVNLNEI